MQYYEKEIDEKELEEIKSILKKIFIHSEEVKNGTHKCMNENSALEINLNFDKLKIFFEKLYVENGYGYKSIIKIVDNLLSYTQIRRLFKKLNIEARIGMAVTTETLKKIRSINAIKKGYFKNWIETDSTRLIDSPRHLSGFLWNDSMKKYVYLRSVWEYAYACSLIEHKENWDVECRTFLLNDGSHYRPDFFIYDNELSLKYITEIKSLYNYEAKERLAKYYKFQKEYPEISSKLITSFEEIASLSSVLYGYGHYNRAWKKQREEYKLQHESRTI